MSKKIELNRRRVLGGLVTVGAASAALGAGTFAVFSDTEESNDNTITAGELTLDVSGGNEGDSSSFAYGFDNIVPGDSATVNAEISVTSDVTTSDITVTTTTAVGDDSVDLADALSIDSITWDSDDISGDISASTIGELNSEDIVLDPAPATGGSATLSVGVSFDESTSNINDYQDTSVDIDHTFTIEQNTP